MVEFTSRQLVMTLDIALAGCLFDWWPSRINGMHGSGAVRAF